MTTADDIAAIVAHQVGSYSPDRGAALLDDVAYWLGTYIKTAQIDDLHTLTLWVAHTHLVRETYTTPRLLLDSPAPGSGKTTVLDHLNRLCFNPVQAASLSSPSLLARLLEKEPRTILIDEADLTLNPKADGVGELLAVLNSGYRRGASRPVLVQQKVEGVTEWVPVEMSTYGPVAMAGNAPNLPDDTRSRCIRVLLLPDLDGTVADSDWQDIEPAALELRDDLAGWAEQVRESVATVRPEYPDGLRGRNRERWAPLLKVALAAGGHWPEFCRKLIDDDLEEQAMDREAGLERTARHLKLLQHVAEVWPEGEDFLATSSLLEAVRAHSPMTWGPAHEFGALTAQGLGRMLVKHFSIRSTRETREPRRRGYRRAAFAPAWNAFAITPGRSDP